MNGPCGFHRLIFCRLHRALSHAVAYRFAPDLSPLCGLHSKAHFLAGNDLHCNMADIHCKSVLLTWSVEEQECGCYSEKSMIQHAKKISNAISIYVDVRLIVHSKMQGDFLMPLVRKSLTQKNDA